MSVIKNIRLVEGLIDKKLIVQLEEGAHLFQRHSNITFKILDIGDREQNLIIHGENISQRIREAIIEVRQGRNSIGKYLDASELIDRVKNLFERFLPGYKIHARPKPYMSPPSDDVTPEWIQTQMNRGKVSFKNIEAETGIGKSELSNWINGNRPMSQPVRTMFFYYFKSKGD